MDTFLIDDDLTLTSFYTFKILDSNKTLYFTDNEDPEHIFGNLIQSISDTPLEWHDVKKTTGITSYDEFAASQHRLWTKSWLLSKDEQNSYKDIYKIEEIKENITQCSNQNDFHSWIFQTENGIKFCLYDNTLYCQNDPGLYGDGRVGLFFGFFKDIYSPPLHSEFYLKKLNDPNNKFAYFITSDEISEIRKQYLENTTTNIYEHDKAEREEQKKYEIGFLSAVFDCMEELSTSSLSQNSKTLDSIKTKIPRYSKMLDSGYDFDEAIGFDFLMEAIGMSNNPYMCQQTNSGRFNILIDTKCTSKILSLTTGIKHNINKIRKLYHDGELKGERSTFIMISLTSIFKYMRQTTNIKTINSFTLYSIISSAQSTTKS